MKKYLALIVVITALAIAGGVWWFFQNRATPYKTAETVQQEVVAQNAPFASGAQLFNANRYTEAVTPLEEALTQAQGSNEKTLIAFYLAAAYRGSGHYVAAINMLQNIVGEYSQARSVQALAVEQMADIYGSNTSTSTRAALFDRPLYKSMIATSSNQTLRRVYQYAASLYPLPYSNYAIARSYANSALAIVDHGTDGQEALIPELIQRLKAAVAAGDAATTAAMDTFTYPTYRAYSLLERAVVLDKLEQLDDTSIGDAGEAYQKAIAQYVGTGGSDATARLTYAHYLARVYGNKRAADITSVLAPLYQVPQEQQLLRAFFTRQGDATGGQAKSDLVQLATIDSGFKSYLQSLGWAETDFN